MKNKVYRSIIAAGAALMLLSSASGVLAATAVPMKGATPAPTTQAATEKPKATEKAASSKATNKPSATSKATSKPKATAKATTKPSATKNTTSSSGSSSKATEEPSETADPSATVDPSASPEVMNISPGTPEPILNVVTSQEQLDAKRYLTKGGAFGWFLLSVLVNTIISFLIGYRFYKMSRKDNHLMAEIRALKKDIDAKMQGNINGFSEYETRVNNSNPNYGRQNSNIRISTELSDEEQGKDIYKKWENQILSSQEEEEGYNFRSARRTQEPGRPNRTSYKRHVEEEMEENKDSVKDKVKGVLNDMFPFNNK